MSGDGDGDNEHFAGFQIQGAVCKGCGSGLTEGGQKIGSGICVMRERFVGCGGFGEL